MKVRAFGMLSTYWFHVSLFSISFFFCCTMKRGIRNRLKVKRDTLEKIRQREMRWKYLCFLYKIYLFAWFPPEKEESGEKKVQNEIFPSIRWLFELYFALSCFYSDGNNMQKMPEILWEICYVKKLFTSLKRLQVKFRERLESTLIINGNIAEVNVR